MPLCSGQLCSPCWTITPSCIVLCCAPLQCTNTPCLSCWSNKLQVRSRTGQELKAGITSLQARDKEAELFENHPELKNVAAEYKGVPALSAKLVQIQAERIQSHLPALQKQVTMQSAAVSASTVSCTTCRSMSTVLSRPCHGWPVPLSSPLPSTPLCPPVSQPPTCQAQTVCSC